MTQFTMTIEKYVRVFIVEPQHNGFFTGTTVEEDVKNILKSKETVNDFHKFATNFCDKRNYKLESITDSEFTYTK